MPRLTFHARAEIALAATLLLGSCGRPEWVGKQNVADVNARNAIHRVSELESRVEEIESRLNM